MKDSLQVERLAGIFLYLNSIINSVKLLVEGMPVISKENQTTKVE